MPTDRAATGASGWTADFLRELRYGARTLRRTPRFTLVVILTLGLGIGAATAIFSVVDAILLRPLPFRDADRLVSVVQRMPPRRSGAQPWFRGFSRQQFDQWRTSTRTLSAMAATTTSIGFVRTSQGTSRLWGGMVSGGTFPLLGSRALIGRTLAERDEANPNVVVLSFDVWRRLFQSDPDIIGKPAEFLNVEGRARSMIVVGVMPPDFAFPGERMEFFVPFDAGDASWQTGSPLALLGSVRNDVSLEAAQQEAVSIGPAVTPPVPADALPMDGPRFEVRNVRDYTVRELRPALRVFFAAVAAVLLIVCANVANLLLARGAGRHREIAVRAAMGASRWRMMRGLLAEGLVLAVTGGVLGALLGALGVTLVRELATVEAPGIFSLMFGALILPRAQELSVDVRVFGIAFGVAALTALLVTILPALHASRVQPMTAFGARGGGGSRSVSRLRSALVIAELAIATMLLIAAGLLVHSFGRLSAVDRGYQASNTLVFQLVFPPAHTVDRQSASIQTIVSRLRAAPEVVAAGFARHGVLIGERITIGSFVPEGSSLSEMRDRPMPAVRPVSGGYLTAVGAHVLQGRDLNQGDVAAVPGIVISRQTSGIFGPAAQIGRFVDWHWNKERLRLQIVGIVEDVRNERADGEATPEVFIDYRVMLGLQKRLGEAPLWQRERALGLLSFAVRTRGEPGNAAALVTRVVRSTDATAGIDAILPLERLVASSVARPKFHAALLALFAGVAALLAAIGVYGVLAYAVEQRTQEIGVRMALGAQRRQVLALVMRRGLVLTLVGLTLGTAGALAGAQVLRSLLFGITPLDSATYACVLALFFSVAALAAYLPARRATRVNPLIALRSE
jgi:putative ABC transport system permease protein